MEVRLGCRVQSLVVEDGVCRGVALEGGARLGADAVVLATGGASYPSTGSTGDGYRLAERRAPRRSAASLARADRDARSWPATLMGLTLKNVRLSAWQRGAKGEKRIYSEMGEMLFTHFGISGTARADAFRPAAR